MNGYWAGVLAAAIGATVGAGEIVSRYRDAPSKALLTLPGGLYVLSNAVAALAALGCMVSFDWPATGDGTWWTRAFAAGFGAVAFFRTSLFGVRVGDQDVPIGPSTVLQVLTKALDQAVDRERARHRTTVVQEIMSEISYEAAGVVLPSYCLALMQNLPKESQETLGAQIEALDALKADNRTKALILGPILLSAVGEDVLRQAVRALAHLRTARTLRVTPADLALASGATAALLSEALDGDGHVLAGRTGRWRSHNPGVASVDDAGIVQAVSAGETRVQWRVDDMTTDVRVTVA